MSISHGASIFDGTWRPDPQRRPADAPPEELRLSDGLFTCLTCAPAYELPADGRSHPLEGHPRFDELAVSVVDERTVRRVGRRGGLDVLDATTVISPDGTERIDAFEAMQPDGRGILLETRWIRIGPPPAAGHRISGRWREIETDLVNHDEDTTYRIVDDALEMADCMGRSFRARLDGSVAPYVGDARFTSVSVRWLDDRTIEESDRNGEEIVFVAQWRVNEDGETMHVRFDDTKGHVMEQHGRRVR
jgi:hypothetical protein